MPWQNNGDGPRRQNPWGQGPNGPNGSGGSGGPGGKPPNVDEMIRKSQEQLKKALPGGKGSFTIVGVIILLVWLASGVYQVDTNEEAVVLQFGQYAYSKGPGLSWHLPYPIQTVEKRGVTTQNTISIGSNLAGRVNRAESYMLTGDENIVDVRFNVVWKIQNLSDYLFSLEDPEGTVKAVAESAMRELVGKNSISNIITTARETIAADALVLIQETLDEYRSGIRIERVQIREAEAPDAVKDAFLDVQRAKADRQRFVNEAQAVANRIVPEAKGQAEKLIQQAEAYRAETVARAEGEAARFISVYNEYRLAQDVTKKRIYLETMEDILAGMNKIILDGKDGGSGVVPYLPLNELQRRGTSGGGN